jgi:hypothetical protein
MTAFLIQHFDALKKLVLTGGDFKNISPSDCKALSLLIFKKTNQQISETTLKRVYGFAYSKFKPSLFTLDAMAKFCDYAGWADFCEHDTNKPKDYQAKNVCWENIKHNADKITSFTLQALKNRSGIPYNQTIKRKFIDDHFDAFLKDDYTATLITAPAGYGKTLALCHWIEEHMAMNLLGVNDDIILFFSSNALINVFISGKDINEWLLSLLGYGCEDDFSTLLDIKQKHNGNFYLIIDGLDEHMFKNEQFHLLLNQILDVFSFYQFNDAFKLVLTMRSSTWINHRHEVEDFKHKWFHGYMIGECEAINVPLFNLHEIKELCTNINPSIQNFLGIEVADNFNHPLYFQFYYRQHKNDFTLNNVDHICIYELISIFILNKIYLGAHSAEKMLLVKALVEKMDFANARYDVDKMKVNDLIRQYSHAYNDLLGIGFIGEMNKSSDLQYSTVIQFCNNNFLDYSIANTLLSNNHNIFDSHLINVINESFHNERKVPILKWCIIYAIKTGQQESFELLAETCLSAREKSEIIIFLGDMFEKTSASMIKTEAMVQYFRQDCSDGLFDYFFGLEFINTDYIKALQTLLCFGLSNKKKILIYTSLATIAIMQLDINKLEGYIQNLKSFPAEDLQALAINPLGCLETVFYFLKYGIVKKEAFAELTNFYFNPPTTENGFEKNNTNDILYLLATYTLSICKNPVKLLRFTNALNKIYKNDPEHLHGYRFLLQLITAEANLLADKIADSLNNYDDTLALFEIEKDSYTPFMKASFYLLKVKMCLYQNNRAGLQQAMKSLVSLADQSGFKLIKVQALVFILLNKEQLNMSADYYKQTYYDFIKIVRESGFREESFINNEVVLAVK